MAAPAFLLCLSLALQLVMFLRLGRCQHALVRIDAHTGCLLDAAIAATRRLHHPKHPSAVVTPTAVASADPMGDASEEVRIKV